MLVRPLLLKNLIDKALQANSWVSWEPETLALELGRCDVPELGKYKKDELFTNLIDAIRAVLSRDSMALMDWHIFENVCTAFANKIPDFFETTPPEPHEVLFAIRFLEDFFPNLIDELSEEVLMYIGSLFVTRGILAYPSPIVNSAIDFVLKHTDLNLQADREEQQDILNKLSKNSKLMKSLADSVAKGGSNLGISDKARPESRRALQAITSFLLLETMIQKDKENLREFLTNVQEENIVQVIEAPDAQRATDTDEHIDLSDDLILDEEVETALKTDAASVAQEPITVEEDLVIISAKEAAAIPGLAGFNYHAGQLYSVTGEVGHDDVPKSKLTQAQPGGDVISKNSTGDKDFDRASSTLTVMDRPQKKKEESAGLSPSDSSLALAEI